MDPYKIKFRSPVMFWTILTTTFFWTTTMRLFFKPEISEWAVFGFSGKGFSGDFWLPILVVLLSIFLFYLEGKGKFRALFSLLLLGWHFVLLAGSVYAAFNAGPTITFGAWGISFNILWLIVPFLLAFIVTVLFVRDGIKKKQEIQIHNWKDINLKLIGIVVLLFPISFLFFHLGEGFNWSVKIAIVLNVVQWILLAQALGNSSKTKSA